MNQQPFSFILRIEDFDLGRLPIAADALRANPDLLPERLAGDAASLRARLPAEVREPDRRHWLHLQLVALEALARVAESYVNDAVNAALTQMATTSDPKVVSQAHHTVIENVLKDIPIVMITSRTAEKHRNYALEIGANHYLGKPYDEVDLLALIAGYIKEKRAS